MIVDKSKYFKYLESNNNLTRCQKQILESYRNNLDTIYVDRKSNVQVKTLIQYIWSNNLVTKIAKTKSLFYSFFDKDFTELLINKVINESLTDKQFINFILETKKNKKISPEKHNTTQICPSWTYIIQDMCLILNKIIETNEINKLTYLDVGCGSGNKTNNFASLLNLKQDNIYGADISNWGPYNQKKYQHKFNFVNISNDSIDMSDDSIDFCTCILMLHHVKNLDTLLKDIKRIIKPDGILLIIEHNNYDDIDNLTLDTLHMLYGYLFDKNNRYLDIPDYAQYHNWVEWDYLISSCNFELIESNSLFTELSNDIRYDNIFYSFYKNIK
jgi:SAM-dependent methyltransferase